MGEDGPVRADQALESVSVHGHTKVWGLPVPVEVTLHGAESAGIEMATRCCGSREFVADTLGVNGWYALERRVLGYLGGKVQRTRNDIDHLSSVASVSQGIIRVN